MRSRGAVTEPLSGQDAAQSPPGAPVPRLRNGTILAGHSLNPQGRQKGIKERGPRRYPRQLLRRLFQDEAKGIELVRETFAAMMRDRRQRGSAIKLVARYAPHLLVRAIEQHFQGPRERSRG